MFELLLVLLLMIAFPPLAASTAAHHSGQCGAGHSQSTNLSSFTTLIIHYRSATSSRLTALVSRGGGIAAIVCDDTCQATRIECASNPFGVYLACISLPFSARVTNAAAVHAGKLHPKASCATQPNEACNGRGMQA